MKIAVPAVTSSAWMVYTGFSTLGTTKVPALLLVHKIVPLPFDELLPATVKVNWSAHTSESTPASLTGAGVMVRMISSKTLAQLPFPLTVIRRVIVPAPGSVGPRPASRYPQAGEATRAFRQRRCCTPPGRRTDCKRTVRRCHRTLSRCAHRDVQERSGLIARSRGGAIWQRGIHPEQGHS